MLVKFKENRMVRTSHIFELFDKQNKQTKNGFLKHTKALTPFWKTFL